MISEIKDRHARLESIIETQNPAARTERNSQSHKDRGVLLETLGKTEAEMSLLRQELVWTKGKVEQLTAALEESNLKLRESRDRETALLLSIDQDSQDIETDTRPNGS